MQQRGYEVHGLEISADIARSARHRLGTESVHAGLVAAAGLVALRFEPVGAAAAEDDGAVSWQPWSRGAVQAALRDDRVVFVDFTADWCISCKVNERLVLADGEVARALGRDDVVALKADWTRPDERIRAELARHGRAGVPMYLVIGPRAPQDPEVLPEVLTPELVLSALRRADPDVDDRS